MAEVRRSATRTVPAVVEVGSAPAAAVVAAACAGDRQAAWEAEAVAVLAPAD